jgi:hypothetical protein
MPIPSRMWNSSSRACCASAAMRNDSAVQSPSGICKPTTGNPPICRAICSAA